MAQRGQRRRGWFAVFKINPWEKMKSLLGHKPARQRKGRRLEPRTPETRDERRARRRELTNRKASYIAAARLRRKSKQFRNHKTGRVPKRTRAKIRRLFKRHYRLNRRQLGAIGANHIQPPPGYKAALAGAIEMARFRRLQ